VVLVAAGVAIAIGWGIARLGERPAKPSRVTAARDARTDAGPPPASRPATATPTKQAPADSVRLAKPAPADTVRLASPWSADAADTAAKPPAPEPEIASPQPGESAASVGPAYGIQVSSNPSRARAAVDSAAWARKGQIVTIVAKDIPEKGGVWYRVVLGRYLGRDEARAAAERLRAAEGLEAAAVVSLPAR
jgi:septal ring-binding cell division protein DamX